MKKKNTGNQFCNLLHIMCLQHCSIYARPIVVGRGIFLQSRIRNARSWWSFLEMNDSINSPQLMKSLTSSGKTVKLAGWSVSQSKFIPGAVWNPPGSWQLGALAIRVHANEFLSSFTFFFFFNLLQRLFLRSRGRQQFKKKKSLWQMKQLRVLQCSYFYFFPPIFSLLCPPPTLPHHL